MRAMVKVPLMWIVQYIDKISIVGRAGFMQEALTRAHLRRMHVGLSDFLWFLFVAIVFVAKGCERMQLKRMYRGYNGEQKSGLWCASCTCSTRHVTQLLA